MCFFTQFSRERVERECSKKVRIMMGEVSIERYAMLKFKRRECSRSMRVNTLDVS